MNDTPVTSPVPADSPMPPVAARTAACKERQKQAAAQRFDARTAVRQRADQLKAQGLFLELAHPAHIAERAARKAGRAEASPDLVQAVISAAGQPARSMDAGIERIIGRNDLLPVAYFARGTLAADAVGRVVTSDGQGHELSYGTGFLVAPDVILTNHHVLPDAETAGLSVIQFGYQAGIDGQIERFDAARIDQGRYLSNEELDFALAGIVAAPGARQRTVVPLIASGAKILPDEPVSIIEHPDAQPKQVALRDNKVIDLLPDFLHYTTDTDPGASGSPVFNDQWEVVALHHASLPPAAPAAGGPAAWVGNEGVRISRIVAYLKQVDGLPPALQQMVAAVLGQEAAAPHPGPEASAVPVVQPSLPTVGAGLQAAPAATRLCVEQGGCIADITISVRARDIGVHLPAPRGEGLLANLAHGAPTALPAFIGQLEAGDVLLYNGTGILSEAIMFFTGSDVSHSALYLGGDAGGLIGEAVDAGVIRDTREQSFPGHNWVVAHRLRGARDMAPVLERGNYYLDKRLQYGYPQLVLLAMLLLVKKVRPAGVFGRMVQAVSVAAAEVLNRFIESGRDLMICSEFVYRTYDEAAAPDNAFHLVIPGIAREAWVPRAGAVEEGSLAAALLANPQLLQSGFMEAAGRAAPQWPLNQELLQQQAEKLVAEYLAEVRYGRPAGATMEEFATDAGLWAAVSRFAIALAAVRRQASRDESLAAAATPAAEGQLPPALQALFRSPADFVTPADLRASPTLAEAGRVF